MAHLKSELANLHIDGAYRQVQHKTHPDTSIRFERLSATPYFSGESNVRTLETGLFKTPGLSSDSAPFLLVTTMMVLVLVMLVLTYHIFN